jgi:Transposase DDE domain group 1
VSCLRENLTSSSYGEGLETDRANSIPRQSLTRQNRIKEQFVLFADRVSAASLRANQLRLYLSVMAYALVCGLRRLGLQATHLANAQVGTIRIRLLKIGAQIRVTVRKIWIQMSSSFPLQSLFRQALQQLRC